MKTKKVNRYTCDFCAKHKYSAGHMSRHEEVCTKNPQRKCRCCRFVDGVTQDIKDLIPLVPDLSDYKDENGSFDDLLTKEANKALITLREKTKNCPACIMAVIRQSGIPVTMVTEFKYKEELENVTKEYWDSKCLQDHHDYNY